MAEPIQLRPEDRLLVVAPHPDDESLATGGLLQHAVSAGAAVRVAYFSDGENNPWAQRAVERRWRIGASDRERFGALRRQEALSALGILGVPAEVATFLGFPDQGATELLLHANERACRALADLVERFRPTLLAAPSPSDLHPDHSAVAVLLRLALARLAPACAPRAEVAYLIHHPLRRTSAEGPGVPLSPAQLGRKRDAILRHRTQLVWRRGWMLSFVTPAEGFVSPSGSVVLSHPLRFDQRDADTLRISLATRSHTRACGRRTLVLRGGSEADQPFCLAVRLPAWSGSAQIVDVLAGRTIGGAPFLGTPWRGEVHLPAALLRHPRILFAKIERRFGFFDEAGWIDALPGKFSPTQPPS